MELPLRGAVHTMVRPAGATRQIWLATATRPRGSIDRVARFRRRPLRLYIVMPQLWPVLVPMICVLLATGSPGGWSARGLGSRDVPVAYQSEPLWPTTFARIVEDEGEHHLFIGGIDARDRQRTRERLNARRRNAAVIGTYPAAMSKVAISANAETPWPVVRDAMVELRAFGSVDIDFVVLTPVFAFY